MVKLLCSFTVCHALAIRNGIFCEQKTKVFQFKFKIYIVHM